MRTSMIRLSGTAVALLAMALGLAIMIDARPAAAEPATVGYRDFSYGTSARSAPTGQKPQSKLWHINGVWWGALHSAVSGLPTVHRLDSATQAWIDTGTVIDTRKNVNLDALWDASHNKLFIASHGIGRGSTLGLMIRRFSYAPASASYSLDSGFPQTIQNNGMEAAVFDHDTLDRLWITYTGENAVYVMHTTTPDQLTWTPPFVVPTEGSTNLMTTGPGGIDEDQSALVSFDGKIGVMWSNQNDEVMYFAIHRDGDDDATWTQNPAVKGVQNSDDHMALRSLQSDPLGRVFAVTKTSQTASGAPLILLNWLDKSGSWKRRTVATAQYNHTRPILLLDRENQNVHVFLSAPCCSGGVIYTKQTSIDGNPHFTDGLGTPFIQSALDTTINNPSSTKQTVDSQSGIVVIASDDRTRFYLHNTMALAPTTGAAPDTYITSQPPATTSSASATFGFASSDSNATFECSLDYAVFAACTSMKTYSNLAPGGHTFQVRAIAAGLTDSTPAAAVWTLAATGVTTTMQVIADTYVSASATTTNYGTAPALLVDANNPLAESLIRFTVPTLDGSIYAARLRVFTTNGSTNGPEVYLASPAWVETSVTWNTRPAALGGMIADIASLPAGAWGEFDVSTTVAAPGDYSFLLRQTSTDGSTFDSRESTRAPELVVQYVPTSAAPDTTIDSSPANPTTLTTAAFTFSSDVPTATFECKLDAAPAFSACTSPATYTGLAAASHTFTVRAVNGGTTDPTPASYTWMVTAPGSSTLTLSPTHDAYVDSTMPNSNFGLSTLLLSDGSPARAAYLKFDLSALAGKTITSAALRMTVRSKSIGQQTLRAVADTVWQEGSITYANRPPAAAIIATFTPSVPSTTINVDVSSWATSYAGGLRSIAITSTSSDGFDFSSAEASSGGVQLIINWTS